MRDKTITVTLGEDLYIKAPQVFQYDYGLMLVLDGVQLPADYEVHFSNKKHGVAKKAEITENGVKIPDEYLRSGEDLFAWVYLRNGDEDGYTVYSIQFPVISRSVEQGDNITPVEHNIIDEAIEALNEAVEQTEQNVLNYPYINEDKYWMVYDAERGEFVNTGVKAQGDNRFNLDIGTVTTLPPGDEATASITWVGDDARLNLGLPAGDTSTLVSVHDERANDVTVTIHDGADNLGVDEFIIAIEPIQEGSGVPGPRNIRRISGVTGVTLTHTAGSYTETYETSFESEAGTVYSGVFNPLTGKLIIDRVLITKRCLDMDNAEVQPGWRNSGIRDIVGTGINQVFENQTLNVGTSYAVDTTGDNDLLYLDYNHYNMRQSEWKNTEITVQICVMLAEPMEYIFESYIPTVQLGDNTFTVNGGKIGYIKYPCDTKKYIEGAIDNSGYYTKPATGIPLADLSSGVTNEISNKIDKSQRGVSGGVAELDQNGKVPSTQLPSYVDDVLEYGSIQSFPLYGETGKIYVARNTNKTYRWGGNGYVEISESLALGETSGSAFRGDHGKIAYDHAIDPNKTTAQAEGLYKVAVTGEGHVASVKNVEKSDITALGIKEPEDVIDDTAGIGDTNKVWSADKTATEIQNVADDVGDLEDDVSDLNTAIGAKYTKPQTGIPAADIADGVIPDVSGKIDATEKGTANGVAELGSDGKVPSGQLPSYVDDVLEYASLSEFPVTGESGKIYIALDTNKTYRWSGSTYAEISESLALGETSATAYRGDRGAAAYAAAVTNVETTPTEDSANLITSGAVYAGLDEKADRTDIPEVPVQDVQVNGSSVLNNGTANVPVASTNDFGVVKISYGLSTNNGILTVSKATDAQVKAGSANYTPIVPSNQDASAFYGLAKAAGDSTQSASSNPVGTYTADAKTAIKSMLGVTDPTVTDVQIDGTSILNNGLANIPKASADVLGLIKPSPNDGFSVASGGAGYVNCATDSQVKAGAQGYRPVSPSRQHMAVFYGLSKLAGEDLASDTVTVGTYPEKSLSAISQMLNAPVSVSGSTPSIAAKPGVRYICGEVSTLTIVVPSSGIIDVTFESGSTPTVLTITPPTGVTIKWPAWFDPSNLEANRTYEINIMDGTYGVVTSWA